MMTREAKIGMLTGLGVIVLIGVLLSEYLGERNTGPAVAAGATGNMAPLPVGAAYREQVLAPVAVPALTPAGGGERTRLAGGGELASGIRTGDSNVPPSLIAAETTPPGPSVSGPVAPIAAGPAQMDGRAEGGPPLITLSETVPVRTTTGGQTPGTTATAAPASTTYTIVAGDTLAKIAKKFYNSSKSADVQRIVAANPKMLKDASTMLVVDKKLVIPNVPAPAKPAAAVVPGAAVAKPPVAAASGTSAASLAAGDSGMVYLPSGAVTTQVPTVIGPPKKDVPVAKDGVTTKDTTVAKDVTTAKKPGTYVVQTGDTLEKIARKMAPTKTTQTVQKLISLNGLQDPDSLKVGQTLKLPV
jgi:LysM repeat protein